jgi:hypothetical protein
VIYFIQAENGGAIKIGFTSKDDVNERVKQLQVGNPYPLRAIAVILKGALGQEQQLHAQFAQFRLCGEWFLPDESLLKFIADNQDRSLSESLERRRRKSEAYYLRQESARAAKRAIRMPSIPLDDTEQLLKPEDYTPKEIQMGLSPFHQNRSVGACN